MTVISYLYLCSSLIRALPCWLLVLLFFPRRAFRRLVQIVCNMQMIFFFVSLSYLYRLNGGFPVQPSFNFLSYLCFSCMVLPTENILHFKLYERMSIFSSFFFLYLYGILNLFTTACFLLQSL